ncbi:MAG: DUF1456 family protein [Verrucomicrobiota bacterium]|nr:DUF1456 family protein [Verrucomicrobiota bacterium]
MTNNYILRRIRYTFDFNYSKMVAIFALGNRIVAREEVDGWLKKEDNSAYKECTDMQLAIFLNGFICYHRGRRKGEQPKPEAHLTNNIILVKLKIALSLKTEDILEILNLSNCSISVHELSALFRKPGNRKYRECKDQILRNFLNGMEIKYRKN